MTRRIAAVALLIGLASISSSLLAGGDLRDQPTYNPNMGGQYTAFTNQGSILNTRHNLMQSTLTSMTFGCTDGDGNPIPCPGSGGKLTTSGAGNMDAYRNNYGEVCVYCHTPHGANTNAAAPLWNRTLTTGTTYQTYDTLHTVTANQTYTQPGGASLPCLSCHDGQQAVDAIINMPGSGRYNPNPSSASGTFSGSLYQRWGAVNGASQDHAALRPASGSTDATSCLSCHQTGATTMAVDFTVFAIGTDLRNDHPVGVTFPSVNGAGTDWKEPTGVKRLPQSIDPNPYTDKWTTIFFDEGAADGKMQKSEIRLYASGDGPKVECASCHDPHGVPDQGGRFNRTFLRKNNTGSAVCLTCHTK